MTIAIFKYLDDNFQHNPNSIIFFPSRMTFKCAAFEIEKTKKILRESGIRPGDLCLMLTSLGDQFHINLIALLQYGAIPVLIDIALGWKTVRRALRGLGVDFIISKHRAVRLPFSKEIVQKKIEGDIVFFTSGSTGDPKPVFYHHQELLSQVEVLRHSRFESPDSSHATLKRPRATDGRILYGYSSLPVFGFYQLLMGMGIWSQPLTKARELQEAMEGRNRGILTDLCLNPKIIGEWVDLLTSRYLAVSDCIERIVVVSNPLSLTLFRQLRLRLPLHCYLEQTYGCTEAFPLCVQIRSGPQTSDTNNISLLNAGKVISKFELILRPSLKDYQISPIENTPVEQIWVKNLSGHLINTGDLGFRNPGGDLVVLGREKYTYQFDGKTYFSMLWELKSREIAEVKDVVLLQEKPGTRPILIVSLSNNKPFIPANLGYRQNHIGQQRILKRTTFEIYSDLRQLLENEFTSEFELLVTDALPLDPRHKTKVLRQNIRVRWMRWSMKNILLQRRWLFEKSLNFNKSLKKESVR